MMGGYTPQYADRDIDDEVREATVMANVAALAADEARAAVSAAAAANQDDPMVSIGGGLAEEVLDEDYLHNYLALFESCGFGHALQSSPFQVNIESAVSAQGLQ